MLLESQLRFSVEDALQPLVEGGAELRRQQLLPRRVQVPNIYGPWSQKPFRVWFLEPEASNIGYLDNWSIGACIGACHRLEDRGVV